MLALCAAHAYVKAIASGMYTHAHNIRRHIVLSTGQASQYVCNLCISVDAFEMTGHTEMCSQLYGESTVLSV